MSIINKICLYSYDIIREEFKSNSFKNLKSNKDNKIIFVDGEKMPIDKEIIDIMQSYELNKGGLNLLYGSYFLEGEKIFTPLIYQDLKLNVDGDAINLNISDEKNLNVGAISSLLENDEEKIELIIQQLIDNIDNPNIDKLLASLVNMQDVEIQIVDKDTAGIGEITAKGPNVMLGYYNDKALTDTVIKDNWFHTGDLGYIDKDGFLFITGRKKDMIVLKNGKKVFPEELELLVNNLEEVEESFIYGLPEDNDKNDVKIAVKIVYDEKNIKAKHPDMSEEELHTLLWNKIKVINKTLPMYKYIKDMTLTTEPLIKTSTQKIKRFEELKKVLESRKS